MGTNLSKGVHGKKRYYCTWKEEFIHKGKVLNNCFIKGCDRLEVQERLSSGRGKPTWIVTLSGKKKTESEIKCS